MPQARVENLLDKQMSEINPKNLKVKAKSPKRYNDNGNKGGFEDEWNFASAHGSNIDTKRRGFSDLENSPEVFKKKAAVDLIDYEDE